MDMAKLLNDIQNALENMVTLEIVTAVGAVTHSKNGIDYDWSKEAKVILTKFDLLQGDIKTVLHPDFVTGEYQGLRDFHSEREKQGLATVRENIKALKELAELIKQWIAPGSPNP